MSYISFDEKYKRKIYPDVIKTEQDKKKYTKKDKYFLFYFLLKFLIITSLPIQIYSLDQIIIKIKNINVAKNFTLFDCSECTCPLNITYNNDTFNITSDQLPTNFYFDNNRMLIDSLIQGQNELIISWDSDITKDINNLFKNCEIIEIYKI